MSKYLVICLFLLGLLLAGLAAGCDQEEETCTPSDALSGIQLLPKPAQTTDPGTASFINIISTRVENDFPQSLNFSIEAESTHLITELQFIYTVPKILRPSVTVTQYPDFEPGTYVEADWSWDARKASIPPGAEIEYKWVIENSAEDRIETETVSRTFDDIRHDWRELEDEDIHLFWYEGKDSFGQELMEAAQQALVKHAETTDSELEEQVQIYIYGSTEDLHDAVLYTDEWTGGMAFPEYGIIAIGVEPYNLEWGKRAVTHELSHMVIYQVTYSPLSDVPAWLDEGIAMYSEGELTGNFKQRLEKAISEDNLFSIRSISGNFPAATEEAELAYAQSYSLVEFLIENFGSAKMQQLLQAFSAGTSLDDALLEVYGFDSKQLETDWRNTVD